MPFTLAHPAAVLPLKRFCPRFLNFSALVVGSIVPDLGYCFGPLHLEDLSHRFVGSFLFSLPIGVVTLAVFYALRKRVVALLPERHQRVFAPICAQPIGSPIAIVLSLLLGVWTHLMWDSFTHTHGWLVRRMPLLQTEVVKIGGHRLEVCHVLWYISSFIGIACLCFAYEKWRNTANRDATPVSRQALLLHAALAGMLVLPIEALHHFAHNSAGFALIGICSTVLVLVVILNFGKRLSASPQKS